MANETSTSSKMKLRLSFERNPRNEPLIDSKTIARSLAKEYVACVRQVRQS